MLLLLRYRFIDWCAQIHGLSHIYIHPSAIINNIDAICVFQNSLWWCFLFILPHFAGFLLLLQFLSLFSFILLLFFHLLCLRLPCSIFYIIFTSFAICLQYTCMRWMWVCVCACVSVCVHSTWNAQISWRIGGKWTKASTCVLLFYFIKREQPPLPHIIHSYTLWLFNRNLAFHTSCFSFFLFGIEWSKWFDRSVGLLANIKYY